MKQLKERLNRLQQLVSCWCPAVLFHDSRRWNWLYTAGLPVLGRLSNDLVLGWCWLRLRVGWSL